MSQVVKASKVKVGDCLYNSLACSQAYRWSQVTSIGSNDSRVIIRSQYFETWKHPDEAVLIRPAQSLD